MLIVLGIAVLLFGVAVLPAHGQTNEGAQQIERVDTPQGEVTVIRPAPRPRPAPVQPPPQPVVIERRVPAPVAPAPVVIINPPVFVDRGGPFVVRRPAPPNVTGNPVPPLVNNPARPPVSSFTVRQPRSNEIIVIDEGPAGTAAPNMLAPPRRR
jgi:hypothetical protein